MQRELQRDKAMKALEKARIVFRVAALDEQIADLSLASDFRDFDDAVQYYSAINAKADCLITRSKTDFRADAIPIMTPEEFLAASGN